MLAAKESLFLTQPCLITHRARREDLLAHARDLFAVVGKGAELQDDANFYRIVNPPIISGYLNGFVLGHLSFHLPN